MSEYKVGDKVRIINHRRDGWNIAGLMDKWMGKVMTIRKCAAGLYSMEEDEAENYGNGWFWSADDFVERVSEKTVVSICFDGNKTTAKLIENGKVVKTAETRRNPVDAYDRATGAKIVIERLFAKQKEAPKYFNGKVVCVESSLPWWTSGKIYDVRNGVITDDDGDRYPQNGSPYVDEEDIRHAGYGVDGRHNRAITFIAVKE